MVNMRESLRELRINLGWSQKDLAREAGVNTVITSNAENGKRITAVKAKALADALSKAYGREIRPLDIEGLNVE
jgi:transcriptional regulator with XRE-family HTH domain